MIKFQLCFFDTLELYDDYSDYSIKEDLKLVD